MEGAVVTEAKRTSNQIRLLTPRDTVGSKRLVASATREWHARVTGLRLRRASM